MKQEELDKLCELEKALQEAKKGARAGNGRRPSNTARQFAVSPDGAIQRKRGRPRKVRPKRDDWKAFVEEIRMTGRRPSLRDIASVMGWSRQRVSQMLDAAGNITREEFEMLMELADGPASTRELAFLARHRAGNSPYYEKHCPHCGGLLRIEGLSRRMQKIIADEESRAERPES